MSRFIERVEEKLDVKGVVRPVFIYTDTQTGVQYANFGNGLISILLEKDGKPQIDKKYQ